jgi:hypothetical protein
MIAGSKVQGKLAEGEPQRRRFLQCRLLSKSGVALRFPPQSKIAGCGKRPPG